MRTLVAVCLSLTLFWSGMALVITGTSVPVGLLCMFAFCAVWLMALTRVEGRGR